MGGQQQELLQLKTVEPLDSKALVTFVNATIVSTVDALNNSASLFEVSLEQCNVRLQRLQAALRLIELKLDSAPDVRSSDKKEPSVVEAVVEPQEGDQVEAAASCHTEESTEAAEVKESQDIPAPSDGVSISAHPVYAAYFKMLRLGVPFEAVKLKMSREGHNPNMLDLDPNSLVPLDPTAPNK